MSVWRGAATLSSGGGPVFLRRPLVALERESKCVCVCVCECVYCISVSVCVRFSVTVCNTYVFLGTGLVVNKYIY